VTRWLLIREEGGRSADGNRKLPLEKVLENREKVLCAIHTLAVSGNLAAWNRTPLIYPG
jgi:hypothetical protein